MEHLNVYVHWGACQIIKQRRNPKRKKSIWISLKGIKRYAIIETKKDRTGNVENRYDSARYIVKHDIEP